MQRPPRFQGAAGCGSGSRIGLASVLALLLPLAALAAPEVLSAPESLLLQEGASAEIVLRSSLPLRAATNLGQLTPVSRSGDKHHYRYTPPDSRAPALAHLAFWSDQEGEAPELAMAPELTVLRLPLLGRTELEVATEPRATIRVEVGGRTFGPVRATAGGEAKVPIEVPPDTISAKVLAVNGRLQTERWVSLEMPPYNPLLITMGPDPMPREGGWVWVLHVDRLEGRALELISRGLRLERVKILRDRALFRVLPAETASEVRLQARLANAPEALASMTLPIDTARPSSISIRQQPEAPADPQAYDRLSLSLAAGGFFRGGSNLGPAVALTAGWRLPVWNGNLAVELELGTRRAALEQQTSIGQVRSEVLAFPLEAALRACLLNIGRARLQARAGGGLVPFSHTVRTELGDPIVESAMGGEAFLALQADTTFGAWQPFVELRGAVGQTRTARVNSSVSGGLLLLGARFIP